MPQTSDDSLFAPPRIVTIHLQSREWVLIN